ncbi:MAG: antitoxin [Anaerovibrio sp.]|nr:antitoxin [Anaerovibrio sp.]
MPKDKLVEYLIEEAWEDELDRIVAEEALKKFEANPVTYTLDEIKAELGL